MPSPSISGPTQPLGAMRSQRWSRLLVSQTRDMVFLRGPLFLITTSRKYQIRALKALEAAVMEDSHVFSSIHCVISQHTHQYYGICIVIFSFLFVNLFIYTFPLYTPASTSSQ